MCDRPTRINLIISTRIDDFIVSKIGTAITIENSYNIEYVLQSQIDKARKLLYALP